MKNLTTFFEPNFVHEKSYKNFVFNDLSTREYQEWKIGKYNIYMA
jgi:hypothetical protein